jgi:tetratricopeptide (TPR) repeat protein/peroxiredoxin
MKTLKSGLRYALFFLIIALLSTASLWAQSSSLKGKPAPSFGLSDVKGDHYDIDKLESHPVLILYFFDAASRTSQEGLLNLDDWVAQYKQADLQAWGITRSSESSVNDLVAQSQFSIPILMDQSDVSDLYNARLILPTVCIIGPNKKVIDFIQGGGKSAEIMLTRLAEVQLQRKQSQVAEKMGRELIQKDPNNLTAKAIVGHAQLHAGEVDQAEETFNSIPSDSTEGQKLQQEGMSEVYLAKGDFDKAWDTANKLEQTAPDSATANVSKAKVLINKGKTDEAEKELAKGAEKKSTFVFQKSEAINKQGRLTAKRGENDKAINLYAQAEEIDPFNIEATSNKGLLLEKEGALDQALESYRKVLNVNQKDIYASVFAKRVEAKLAVENDIEKKKRMDALIKDLSARFKDRQENAKTDAGVKDDWTSRPMVLSFINLKESGGLPDRDGFVLVLADQLSEFLNESGRIKVVDRRMMEAIISELNLGSSDLADPQTALKLGKLFAAKIIVTGTVHYLPNETLLSLRLLDTETSMVAKAFTRQLNASGNLEKELGWLNKEILKTVTNKYPLKGYVADVKNDQVMINLGENQGVVLGTQFAVLKEGEPMTYKGKTLSGALKKVALLKVVQVEPEFSMTQIVTKESDVKQDDKITETVTEL